MAAKLEYKNEDVRINLLRRETEKITASEIESGEDEQEGESSPSSLLYSYNGRGSLTVETLMSWFFQSLIVLHPNSCRPSPFTDGTSSCSV